MESKSVIRPNWRRSKMAGVIHRWLGNYAPHGSARLRAHVTASPNRPSPTDPPAVPPATISVAGGTAGGSVELSVIPGYRGALRLRPFLALSWVEIRRRRTTKETKLLYLPMQLWLSFYYSLLLQVIKQKTATMRRVHVSLDDNLNDAHKFFYLLTEWYWHLQ